MNQYGSVFQITAATTGAHAAEREDRLKDIDRAPLIDVTAAQTAMQQYQQHQRQEWRQQRDDNYRQSLNEKVSPVAPPLSEHQSAGLFRQAANEAAADHRTEDLRGVAAEVWELYRRAGNEHSFDTMHEATLRHSMKTGDREAFAAALDDYGISFARATKEEADTSHRQAAFAREIGNYAPRYKEGEIVIITEAPLEYRREGQPTEPRRVHKLDPAIAEKFVQTLGTGDKLQSIEATINASNERAQQRRGEREELRLERAIEKAEAIEKAIDLWSFAPKRGKAEKTPAALRKAPARAIGGALDIATQLTGLLFSLDAPKSPKQQAKENRENAKATARSNAKTEFQIDVAQYADARAQEQSNRQQQHQQEQANRDREAQAARDREREQQERGRQR